MVELRLSLGRISSSKRTFLTRPSRCVEHFQGEFQDLSGSLAPSLYLYLKKNTHKNPSELQFDLWKVDVSGGGVCKQRPLLSINQAKRSEPLTSLGLRHRQGERLRR